MTRFNEAEVSVPRHIWDQTILALDQALGRLHALDAHEPGIVTRQVVGFGEGVLRAARQCVDQSGDTQEDAQIDLRREIENSADGRVRVHGGAPGTEDYDEGWARISQSGDIVVAWDSGVTTPLPNPLGADLAYRADPSRAFGLEPSLGAGERQAMVRHMSDEELARRHADTLAGIGETRSARRKLELDAGRTALEAELKSRGLDHVLGRKAFEAAPAAPGPGGKPSRGDRGPSID